MTTSIRFLLNDQEMDMTVPPGLLVLDLLRHHLEKTGTKEGCKEGDCGACTVLLGELTDSGMHYRPVTSCLLPAGEIHGKHLVTVEGLNLNHLTIVQEAIVNEGATQCGFCTPAIVVSLTYGLMEKGANFDDEDVKYVLSGHLCRCTGYASLLRAGKLIQQKAHSLTPSATQSENILQLIEKGILPSYFSEVPEKLKRMASIPPGNGHLPSAKFIAGGTDIYVQEGESLPDLAVTLLNLFPEMKGIVQKGKNLHIGALTTFEEFAAHPLIQKAIPRIKDYMLLNASLQVRNRATIGGNIVNASPIADMVILLLALNAELILTETSPTQKDKPMRRIRLRNFYKGYKKLDKSPTELVKEIVFSIPEPDEQIHFEKVSKRRHLDIASVNSAIRISLKDNIINQIHLSMGGVAPIPLYLSQTCDYLSGKELNLSNIQEAMEIAQTEISPISDIRGSAEYKRLLSRNLFIAHFCELFPDQFSLKDLLNIHG
ncbi:MAG: (2Fe-2S)-binding protein [Calditrichaeota bacterium]|nr:MAG: (2Fe-2S)-binding protein [Calditrichota bacterium]